jgi:uncharacterized RDD family membrane protein YckC
MKCVYCGSPNSALDHRCTRCGRRLPPPPVITGALAAAPMPAESPQEIAPPQRDLFGNRPASKIIPFKPAAVGAKAPGAVRPPVRAVARRTAPPASRRPDQPTLDFLPPAQAAPRTLKTQVEAVIYCDAPVATPAHRAVAAALDLSLILIGYGLFLGTFHLCGGEFMLNRATVPVLAAAALLLALFYGLLWVMGSADTAGMRWTHLRLIDFDGFPAGRRERFLRYCGFCLSVAAGGLGVLWALVDEESLTWQDHISKTFPTLDEGDSNFVRKR